MRKNEIQSSVSSSVQINTEKNSGSSFLNSFWACIGGIVLGIGAYYFALYFPHLLTPSAAKAIYIPALYTYDPQQSHFDNSMWTYGTDYILALVMFRLTAKALSSSSSSATRRLRLRLAGLTLLYAVSVIAGGLAHQFYTTLEHRNSPSFRLLWTICVGSVTAAGGMMGACASEVAFHYGGFRIPEWTWIGCGGFLTAICTAGWISFQRPACDIFIAGTSQSPPSFYMVGIVYARLLWKRNKNSSRNTRTVSAYQCWKCILAFVLNAPLLPGYALALQIPDVSLATINTALHVWLCISWSMQSDTIRYFIQEIETRRETPKHGKSH